MTQVPLTAFVTGLGRPGMSIKPMLQPSNFTTRVQSFTSRTGRIGRRKMVQTGTQSQSLKEKLMAPAGEGAFTWGRGLVAGASALGIGALCFYGLGLSNEPGTIERSMLWPKEVKLRIRDTYMYFGATVGVTAMSAVAVSRNPRLMGMMMKNSWMAIGATFAAMIGTGMVCRSIPYKEGLGVKQLAWLTYGGVMGAVVAPLTLMGGPLLIRAAWYTAGVVGGLSLVAMSAPSDKFLTMGGPLAAGLGVVLVSSLGGMFFPPTTALGAGLYSISIYGGLVLFGAFLLYDTQKIVRMAETYPVYSARPYDPINASMGIYLDTLNIFIRLAIILSGGNRRK